MEVRNVHERRIAAPPSEVGALLDTLSGPSDRLWPRDRWPSMRLDGPLAVGAAGGHGPIRYTVVAYEPGLFVRFRFTRPRGFQGTHGFSVEEAGGGTLLRHELVMRTSGSALLAWLLVFRPLHDAVIRDALERAAVAVGHSPRGTRWPLRVRVLRRLLRPRRRRSA